MTLETASDLEFCNLVMLEGLRIMPAAPHSEYYESIRDVRLGSTLFSKGDMFTVQIESLAHNPAQWQRPLEFLPERFDHTDPLYLTPRGKKRHTYAMVPFLAGPRVCFGKTLAESTMKVTITYFTQVFDMEFEDPKFNEKELLSQIDASFKESCWI